MDVSGGIYYYDSEAQANAEIEQVRADALKVLRTATSFSVCALSADGKAFHTSVSGEADALVFLAYAAARSANNLRRIMGSAEAAHDLIDRALTSLEESEE